jgi:hypothetical protein
VFVSADDELTGVCAFNWQEQMPTKNKTKIYRILSFWVKLMIKPIPNLLKVELMQKIKV